MDTQKVKGALVRAYGILGGQMYNVSDIEEAFAELDKPASEDARLLVDLWALEHSGKYESAQTANADLAKRIDSYAAKQVAAALEAERAKGPGVWDGAPDWAQIADIRWCNRAKNYGEWRKESYTRNATPRLRAESIIGPKGEKLDGDEWERAVAAVERELG